MSLLANLPELLLSMRLSLCAYDVDENRARQDFAALGCEYVGLAKDGDFRWVYVVRLDGRNWIVGQGTRVTENFDPAELWDDAWLVPVKTPHGLAPEGFWEPAYACLPQIRKMLDTALPCGITGHSLGGETALMLAPEFPGARVYPISNPTGASREFLSAIKAEILCPYTRSRDFAHWHGVGIDFHQPSPIIWDWHQALLEVADRTSWFNLSLSDHSLEGSIASVQAHLTAPSVRIAA